VWDWCPFYVQAVQMVKDGSFAPGEFYGGLADGTVALAPLNAAVPEDIKAMVEERRQALIDGTLDYWQGPLQDNAGNEVVAAGQTLSIDDINGMSWLVDGVVGKIPGQ
jgi:basic membrane protein A